MRSRADSGAFTQLPVSATLISIPYSDRPSVPGIVGTLPPRLAVNMRRHEHGLTVFNPPDDARQMQRAVIRRDVHGKHILVAVGLGQFLFSGTSTAPRRLLFVPPLIAGAFVFGFQRILVIQSLGRVLAITITELLIEPSILDPQFRDRLLLVTNGLLQFRDQLPQFTNCLLNSHTRSTS